MHGTRTFLLKTPAVNIVSEASMGTLMLAGPTTMMGYATHAGILNKANYIVRAGGCNQS